MSCLAWFRSPGLALLLKPVPRPEGGVWLRHPHVHLLRFWFSCRQRAGEAEVGCTDAKRFELELEFLQCLANPGYLNCAPRDVEGLVSALPLISVCTVCPPLLPLPCFLPLPPQSERRAATHVCPPASALWLLQGWPRTGTWMTRPLWPT